MHACVIISEHNWCALLLWLNLYIYIQLGKRKLPVGAIFLPFSSVFSFHAFTICIVLRIDPLLPINSWFVLELVRRISVVVSNAIWNLYASRSSHYTWPHNKTILSLCSRIFKWNFSLPCFHCACRYNLIKFFQTCNYAKWKTLVQRWT